MPVLAPMKWNADGWPVLQITGNTWGASYPYPLPPHPLKPLTGTDRFRGSTLSPQWEWNHNPDNSKWSVHNGLTLKTATVTHDLYRARNTLTHRILGPGSTATIVLDDSRMKDGDRAGLAMFRDSSAWVGIKRDHGADRVVMEDNLTMNRKWQTTNTGTEVASHPVSRGRIWLREIATFAPGRAEPPSFLQYGWPHLQADRQALPVGHRLAFFYGIPVRHLQLCHPVAGRLGQGAMVRDEYTLIARERRGGAALRPALLEQDSDRRGNGGGTRGMACATLSHWRKDEGRARARHRAAGGGCDWSRLRLGVHSKGAGPSWLSCAPARTPAGPSMKENSAG